MKKISLILLFISTLIGTLKAQPEKNYRDVGILFEISNNPNWGYGEPVITFVQPYSPAYNAGLKRGDIIMEVNGYATYLRDLATISGWLTEGSNEDITLTVRNINTYFKEFPLEGNIRRTNSLTEFDLASMFSFYSIENTYDRVFTLPLKVDPNQNIDFSDYHTFDFIDEGSSVPDVDAYINREIEKALVSRGLTRDQNNPDMLVQTYYSYQPNIKYGASPRAKNQKTWRYDSDSKEMIQVPFLSADDPNSETKGTYILELGIRFFDKKEPSEDNKMTQIWDCKSTEYLTSEYDLGEYARIHAPLMALQYPYSIPKSSAKYIVSNKKYNYTGMNFDAKDLKTLTSVDKNSPAYKAGIRKGDVVEKINNTSFDYSKAEINNAYNRFIIASMKLRNPKTRFIDANGFPDCMYWSSNRYPEVVELFKKEPIYMPCFSYLYSFQKYVSSKPSKTVDVEVKSDGQKKKVQILPEQQSSVEVKAL